MKYPSTLPNLEKYTDNQLIDYMKDCITIIQWNFRRDRCKEVRNYIWISRNIDFGLIKK